MYPWLDQVPAWFTVVFIVLALLAIFIGYLWLTSKEYREVVYDEAQDLWGGSAEGYTPDGAPEVPPGGCGTVTGMRLKVVPEYTYGRTFETEYGRQAAQAYGVRLAQAAQKGQMAADLASGAAQGEVAAAIDKNAQLQQAMNDTRVANGGADSSESFQENDMAAAGWALYT